MKKEEKKESKSPFLIAVCRSKGMCSMKPVHALRAQWIYRQLFVTN